MTISLCMIVKDEELTLGRCLDCICDIVDEIIVVDTGSTDSTKAIAAKYTDKIYDFEWIDDFAAARNFSFSKATMEYIMWLDADDVILESDREKLKFFKQLPDNTFDVAMMRYNLGTDSSELPTCSFMRERLLKREKGFKWNDPVHEYIPFSGKIVNTNICITHKKIKERSDRNLRIFEKIIAQGKPLSDRNLFYYARELYFNKRFEEAITYYNRFLETTSGIASNYIDASIDLSNCYKAVRDEKNILKALLKSFEHDLPRAEICCQIGFYYKLKEDYVKAIFWYGFAANLKIPENEWGAVIRDFYEYIPNMELSCCYFHLGDIDNAIKYNDIALEFKPGDEKAEYNKGYFEWMKLGGDKLKNLKL